MRGAGDERAKRPDPPAQRGQPRRHGPDAWSTPPDLSAALCRHVLPELPAGPVWEPAVGDGRLAAAMRRAGRHVITSDLYPQDRSAPIDFLRDPPPVGTAGVIVVTNPPFNQTDAFLARGLDLFDRGHTRGLVLLMRHDHLQAGGRVEVLNRSTFELHCCWRPVWIVGSTGNPRWSFHWITWTAGPRRAPLYVMSPDAQQRRRPNRIFEAALQSLKEE